MLSYVLRRLLWMVPTMIGITVLLFCVMQLAPGDPAALKTQGEAGGMGSGSSATADVESAYEKFRKRYKLEGTPIRIDFREGENPYAAKKNVPADGQQKRRQRTQGAARRGKP